MFHLKKFTCSVLAALAIGNSVLSLPADTSNMSNNVVSVMAAEDYPLEYAVCTKKMIVREDHKSDSAKKRTIPAGAVIDLTKVRKCDIWVNPKNHSNIWVKNFKLHHEDTDLHFEDEIPSGWVCISNSSIKVPTHNSWNTTFLYSSPNTKSTKIQNPFVTRTPIYVNEIRINNDEWGVITYIDTKTNKTVTGYVLMCNNKLKEIKFKWDAFDYIWYKDALYD